MFIHISKIVEHANAWLAKEGHAIESEVGKVVQGVVNFIGHKSQIEAAVSLLEGEHYTVQAPPAAAEQTPHEVVGGSEVAHKPE